MQFNNEIVRDRLYNILELKGFINKNNILMKKHIYTVSGNEDYIIEL